jgi:hypothetical protein
MFSGLVRVAYLFFACPVAVEGKADVKWLVYEQQMSEYIPWVAGSFYCSVHDPNGTYLSKGSKHGTGSGSTLQPNHEGEGGVGLVDVGAHCTEELVVHAAVALGVVPIDLLIPREALEMQIGFVEASAPELGGIEYGGIAC